MATVGDVTVADSAQQAVIISDAATAPTLTFAVNLLTPNQADVETDITGFTLVGGSSHVTLTRDTLQAWHGAASLKVVTDGAFSFQGVEVRVPVTPNKFKPGGPLTISAFLFHPTGGQTLRFYVQADTGSIGTVGSITLAAGWNRFTRTITLPNPITQAYFSLRWDSGGTPQAVTLWMDGMQMEAASAATQWGIAAGVATLADSAVHAVTIGDMRAP